ncbi:transglutaminase-like cysteine peptidase [Arcobacter sp. FWKO B]|uniref:transglutaminase-like cysteine peptidase n=1 Tax=Arcobacter sp. FWKO B TaxID=2593672 RepID=UPI0018A3BC74|nr:transglutaminase-like cysteine peptidase [Arcobacter sp. FWKO B]QOG11575.1 hypothetical protein FWKOB_02170 [Arcobacter sp. FWKO B]
MFKIVLVLVISLSFGMANDTKRLQDLEQFLNTLPQKTIIEKLNSVNFYFNQIVSAYDSLDNINHDEWNSMIDFILKGRGDCEEYAISKYKALKLTGIDTNKLFLMVVKEKTRPQNEFHLVTAYYENDENPLILDNLSFRVLPLIKRSDLEPIMIFDTNNTFTVTKSGKIDKITMSNFPQKLKLLEEQTKLQFNQYNISTNIHN